MPILEQQPEIWSHRDAVVTLERTDGAIRRALREWDALSNHNYEDDWEEKCQGAARRVHRTPPLATTTRPASSWARTSRARFSSHAARWTRMYRREDYFVHHLLGTQPPPALGASRMVTWRAPGRRTRQRVSACPSTCGPILLLGRCDSIASA